MQQMMGSPATGNGNGDAGTVPTMPNPSADLIAQLANGQMPNTSTAMDLVQVRFSSFLYFCFTIYIFLCVVFFYLFFFIPYPKFHFESVNSFRFHHKYTGTVFFSR